MAAITKNIKYGDCGSMVQNRDFWQMLSTTNFDSFLGDSQTKILKN